MPTICVFVTAPQCCRTGAGRNGRFACDQPHQNHHVARLAIGVSESGRSRHWELEVANQKLLHTNPCISLRIFDTIVELAACLKKCYSGKTSRRSHPHVASGGRQAHQSDTTSEQVLRVCASCRPIYALCFLSITVNCFRFGGSNQTRPLLPRIHSSGGRVPACHAGRHEMDPSQPRYICSRNKGNSLNS